MKITATGGDVFSDFRDLVYNLHVLSLLWVTVVHLPVSNRNS